MTTSDVFHILFGAALVSIGVLATALADRIRGRNAAQEDEHFEAPRRPRGFRAHAARTSIQVVGPAELHRSAESVKTSRPVRMTEEGGDTVIAALVAAGYKKPIATEATWACVQVERSSIESWTKAALRRAKGGMS